ncbi:unnamed protein product [Camellia sinensis]
MTSPPTSSKHFVLIHGSCHGEWSRYKLAFMASLPRHERVVLVGHSFGGFAVCQAMENFPEKIYVAVFVTAMMPGPSFNISTLFQE